METQRVRGHILPYCPPDSFWRVATGPVAPEVNLNPPGSTPKVKKRKSTTPAVVKCKRSKTAVKPSSKKKQKASCEPSEEGSGLVLNESSLADDSYSPELNFMVQHAGRRDVAALAWEALIPSLVYPLMCQLARVSGTSPSYRDANGFTQEGLCNSGCSMSEREVQVISFGGEFVLS